MTDASGILYRGRHVCEYVIVRYIIVPFCSKVYRKCIQGDGVSDKLINYL